MNILEFAINMELEGQNYYDEQARLNKDNGLFRVFSTLAEDEKNHAEILQNKKAGKDYTLTDTKFSSIENVFGGDDLKISDIKTSPEQLDLYRFALDKEEESIKLYKKLLSKADADKELFNFLIKEEENHHKIIENIVEMVSRPKEWVESAEFGVRDDY